MRKRDGFVILPTLAVVLIILTIVGLYILYTNQKADSSINTQTKPVVTYSPNTSDEDVQYDWKLPEISNDFNWKTTNIDPNSDEGLDYRIFLDSRNSSDDKSQFREANLGGTLYETSVTDTGSKYDDLNEYVRNQLISELIELEWVSSVYYGNWYISGMAADGAFSSSYGLIKMNGKEIRTIVISYKTKADQWDGPGSEARCPCLLDAKVFVSDVGNIEDYTN